MTRLAKYSADLYVKLEEETGVATGMRQVRLDHLALTEDRARNSCGRPSLARAFDVEVQRFRLPRSRRCIRM
jgi:glycine/D-amino acid oxidase-like deaminating enzyme